MNDGRCLKKIFTVGNSCSSVVECFSIDWKFGWIEHIRLSDTPNDFFTLENQSDFFSIFVIDAEIRSLNLFKSVIEKFGKNVASEVVVLCEMSLTYEQQEIINEVNENTTSSVIIAANRESLDSIIECYAHLLCGESYCCVDFDDMHEWLHAGTTFMSAGSYIDAIVKNELPYMLYLQLTELKERSEKSDLEVAAINVVFLGEYISQDLFSASLAMISGSFSRDLNLSVHSNIHDSHQNGKVGFRIFASLKKKTPLSFDHNEIPPFLLA
ncbi:hypothetical protein WG68_11140 [Arsukibacterium ikkense]|uniref:Uncharacterized protein n=1 Tax=Arsukibacterium ikkense TaxID=336831 RepID=A0A0M2V7Z1_9GAMM|nr:hypothetical protein [Arsukibacterium ikkense]KKO45273.1 hypothetical protein WG68_11140 [Arsukibacterium ikkense]